jgi:predicted metal-dependent HD superfamily phosphohydrolase
MNNNSDNELDFDSEILEIEAFVRSRFTADTNKDLFYHNLNHTVLVSENAAWLVNEIGLTYKQRFVVLAASWFHDLGYLTGKAQGHEELGANEALAFLKNIDNDILGDIKGCILATKMPQEPKNILEKIVCDADLFHLGTSDFQARNMLMRKEYNQLNNKKITKKAWRKESLELLQKHKYHTDICLENLKEQKEKNITGLIKKKESKTTEALEKPTRGIETMFRVSSSNQQRLSDMADNKAHILITTTSIIISVILSILFRQLEDHSTLIIPTFILLVVCVSTMVFAILATRPTIPAGRFTQEDVDAKRVNFLFFGNFYRMPFEEYSKGVKKLMNDSEFLYGNLTQDVYYQGIVLGKKYRLLRTAYSVFMFGIITSALAFVTVILLNNQF